MIIKSLEPPILMQQTEALSRRLSPHHSKKAEVNESARRLRAGYNGEKSLDFHLRFLQDDAFHILHNIRIPDENDFFQMDNLINSRQLILINEVKNISGTVIYDEFGQAIRIRENGKEENMGNHLEQVNLQHSRLLRLMRNYNLPPIPIEKLITYSNPNTIIKNITNNKSVANMVIHKEQLLTRISDFARKHHAVCYTDEQLQRLSDLLIALHTPKQVNILEKFHVMCEQIQYGVICPDCGALPMIYSGAKWNCAPCGATSKVAYLDALQDLCLLFGGEVSIRQIMQFLRLDGRYITYRLMKKAGFERLGDNKGSRYILKF